jgi:hypothetical protein
MEDRFGQIWTSHRAFEPVYWMNINHVRIEYINTTAEPLVLAQVNDNCSLKGQSIPQSNPLSEKQQIYTSSMVPIGITSLTATKPPNSQCISTSNAVNVQLPGPVWQINRQTMEFMDPTIFAAANAESNAFHKARHTADQEIDTGTGESPPNLMYATRGEKLRWCRKNQEVYRSLSRKVRRRRDRSTAVLKKLIEQFEQSDGKAKTKNKSRGMGSKLRSNSKESDDAEKEKEKEKKTDKIEIKKEDKYSAIETIDTNSKVDNTLAIKKEEPEIKTIMTKKEELDSKLSTILNSLSTDTGTQLSIQLINRISHVQNCLRLIKMDLKFHKRALDSVLKMQAEVQDETLPEWDWRLGLQRQGLLDKERGEIWMQRLIEVVEECHSREIWVDVFGDDGLGWVVGS